MADSKADLILHPVRMRILTALAGKQLTAQQLAAILTDVPQATLYRHINRLAKGGVLAVAEERPVRGTVEKVYALNQQGAWLSPSDIANFSKDDHMHLFTAFVATLLGDFARYLASVDQVDPLADGLAYSKAPLYLSDEELRELSRQMGEIVAPVLAHAPAPERKRRLFISIVMPDTDELP